jgi:hypothetical protein
MSKNKGCFIEMVAGERQLGTSGRPRSDGQSGMEKCTTDIDGSFAPSLSVIFPY